MSNQNLDLLLQLERVAPIEASRTLLLPAILPLLDEDTKLQLSQSVDYNHCDIEGEPSALGLTLLNWLSDKTDDLLLDSNATPTEKVALLKYLAFLDDPSIPWEDLKVRHSLTTLRSLSSSLDIVRKLMDRGMPLEHSSGIYSLSICPNQYRASFDDTLSLSQLRLFLTRTPDAQNFFSHKELVELLVSARYRNQVVAVSLLPDLPEVLSTFPVKLDTEAACVAFMRGCTHSSVLITLLRDYEIQDLVSFLETAPNPDFTSVPSDSSFIDALMTVVSQLHSSGYKGEDLTDLDLLVLRQALETVTREAEEMPNDPVGEDVLGAFSTFLLEQGNLRKYLPVLADTLLDTKSTYFTGPVLSHPDVPLTRLPRLLADRHVSLSYQMVNRPDFPTILPQIHWNTLTRLLNSSAHTSERMHILTLVWEYLSPVMNSPQDTSNLLSMGDFEGTLQDFKRLLLRLKALGPTVDSSHVNTV